MAAQKYQLTVGYPSTSWASCRMWDRTIAIGQVLLSRILLLHRYS